MALHVLKETALLSWINRVCPDGPVHRLQQLTDDHRLITLARTVLGGHSVDLLPSPDSDCVEMILSFLQDEFQFSSPQAAQILQKFSHNIELSLQIAKVVLVLCYCGFQNDCGYKNHNLSSLDMKTWLMISSMFHFIQDDADGLSLDEDLDRFLTKGAVMTFSTSSDDISCCSPSYTNHKSPFFSHAQKRETSAALHSPVHDVLSTPELLKRLRNQLALNGDVRDELEKELAKQMNIVSEKEALIGQLQHRVERTLRQQEELENHHKAALLELQEKNQREHEVVKQYKELETEYIRSLQSQILQLSEQISLKNEEIRNLRNKYHSAEHELKLVKEQNMEMSEMIKSNRKEHEETVRKIQQEKHEEMLVLSVEMTSLKEQIYRNREHDLHKQQELTGLEKQHNVLKENLAVLQNQLVEATSTASQKESELILLHQELCHQKSLREKALEIETVKHEEFERKVTELQAKILEISTFASEREAQVIALQNDLKNQELSAKLSEAELHRLAGEKVESLQGELDVLSRCAAEKDNVLGSLTQKLKNMEELFLQKEKDVLELRKAKEDLEKRIVENQQLKECQQILELVRKERDHLSTEATSLKEKIQHTEVKKQQEMSALERERNLLKQNMAILEKKVDEETTRASQRNSELLLLQQELHQQKSFRVTTKELEKIVKELQGEISTLVSEKDAHESALQSENKYLQLRSDKLRAHLELKVERQNGSILSLKSDARKWEQQNMELLEKLKNMFGELQRCMSEKQEVQKINRTLEKSLQVCRREVKALQMERDQAKSKVDEPWKTSGNTEDMRNREPEMSLDTITKLQLKRRPVMFMIANTPKSRRTATLLRSSLRSDGTLVSALRKGPHNNSPKNTKAKKVKQWK